jgi:hypothetical protein
LDIRNLLDEVVRVLDIRFLELYVTARALEEKCKKLGGGLDFVVFEPANPLSGDVVEDFASAKYIGCVPG